MRTDRKHLENSCFLELMYKQILDLVVHGALAESIRSEGDGSGVVLVDGSRLILRASKVREQLAEDQDEVASLVQ